MFALDADDHIVCGKPIDSPANASKETAGLLHDNKENTNLGLKGIQLTTDL